ncbi:MAG: hypothetical protein HC817_13170, partial [Saprospiraceae bacterium]|nr:hypothetical protein [Saprospiraceae bacterium]
FWWVFRRNVTVDCNTIPNVPTVTATDNCSQVTPQYSEQKIDGKMRQ